MCRARPEDREVVKQLRQLTGLDVSGVLRLALREALQRRLRQQAAA